MSSDTFEKPCQVNGFYFYGLTGPTTQFLNDTQETEWPCSWISIRTAQFSFSSGQKRWNLEWQEHIYAHLGPSHLNWPEARPDKRKQLVDYVYHQSESKPNYAQRYTSPREITRSFGDHQ